MVNVSRVAMQIGELRIPPEAIIEADALDQLPGQRDSGDDDGQSGRADGRLDAHGVQPSTASCRSAQSDTVIISATPIPGNEKSISRVIDQLYRCGANVIYKALAEVHVSGHACQEELKLMHALVKPKYFIPVHGEYRHAVAARACWRSRWA